MYIYYTCIDNMWYIIYMYTHNYVFQGQVCQVCTQLTFSINCVVMSKEQQKCMPTPKS